MLVMDLRRRSKTSPITAPPPCSSSSWAKIRGERGGWPPASSKCTRSSDILRWTTTLSVSIDPGRYEFPRHTGSLAILLAMRVNEPINVVRANSGEWAEVFDKESFVGVDFDIGIDLTRFSRSETTKIIEKHADKNPVSNGLRAGMLDYLAHGLKKGDIVVSPLVDGRLRVGRIAGEYVYHPSAKPRHRRPVQWLGTVKPSRQLTAWNTVFTIQPDSSLYPILVNDLAQVPDVRARNGHQSDLEERRVRALELLAKSAAELVAILGR